MQAFGLWLSFGCLRFTERSTVHVEDIDPAEHAVSTGDGNQAVLGELAGLELLQVGGWSSNVALPVAMPRA